MTMVMEISEEARKVLVADRFFVDLHNDNCEKLFVTANDRCISGE